MLYEKQGLLLVLKTDDGQVGLGECSPLAGFSAESLADALCQLQGLSELLFSQSDCVERMTQMGAGHCLGRVLYPSVSFALEGASLALCGKIPSADVPTECCPLLMGTRQQVMAQWVSLSSDATEIKLKVGRIPLDEEIAQINDFCQQTAPSLSLRLDANRQWSFSEAETFCRSIDAKRIAFIEEPLADYQRLPEFGALTGFPLALDESLQVPDCRFEPFTALVAIVVKPMLVGGIVQARRLIKKTQHEGLRAIVSASYESPQGMQQLAWLAATDTPGELPGLDTLRAFDDTAVVHFKQCLQQGVNTGQFQTLEKVWQSTAAH